MVDDAVLLILIRIKKVAPFLTTIKNVCMPTRIEVTHRRLSAVVCGEDTVREDSGMSDAIQRLP